MEMRTVFGVCPAFISIICTDISIRPKAERTVHILTGHHVSVSSNYQIVHIIGTNRLSLVRTSL